MTERLNACLRQCLECGQESESKGSFCGKACRMAFNNRRLQRGAELYDLYMAHRFERELAKRMGIFQAINRLASNFRHEDLTERAGRKSWRNPRLVMEERVYLKAMGGRVRAGR